MIKNIFEVNNEEKSRILNLHESATKRQYLSEDENTSTTTETTMPWDSKSKQVQGGGNPEYANFFIGLVDNDVQGVDEAISEVRNPIRRQKLKNLKSEVSETINGYSAVDSDIRNDLQNLLSKETELVKKLVEIAKKLGVNPEDYFINF